MQDLVRDTLAFLQQEYAPGDQISVSADDFAYFTAAKPAPKPVPAPRVDPMPEMRALLSKTSPTFRLRKEAPEDSRAKNLNHPWREDFHVVILSFGGGPFLNNVAAAITALLTPCKVIDALAFEKEKKWELLLQAKSLKLILAPPVSRWKTTSLGAHFRENPTLGEATLFSTPLLPLQPIENYLKNPDLKRTLWKSLVSRLSS